LAVVPPVLVLPPKDPPASGQVFVVVVEDEHPRMMTSVEE
jgi:hypothetical protein